MYVCIYILHTFRCKGESRAQRDDRCQELSSKSPESVFVNLLRSPGIDSQLGGPVRNPICRTGLLQATQVGGMSPGNRFLGTLTFTNTSSKGEERESYENLKLLVCNSKCRRQLLKHIFANYTNNYDRFKGFYDLQCKTR